MRNLWLSATALMLVAGGAHAQSMQSGTIGGMQYFMLPASGGCSAATPCSVVTYLSVQSESQGETQSDLSTYFGGAFQAANPHTIVIAPVENGPQDEVTNWGGYNTPTTPEGQQMVGVVQAIEQQMGNTVNPQNSVVTGGSLGGTGTQAALIAYGPKGQSQPGVFSAGVSFDAADWSAAGNPSEIAALCGVPLTAVHGTDDTNQSISFDQNLASAINGNPACGNSFTLVPIQGAGHGTWAGPSGYQAGTGPGTPLATITSDLNSAPVAGAAATALAQAPAMAATMAMGTPGTSLASVAATGPSAAAAPAALPSAASAALAKAPATASSQLTPGNGSVTDCNGTVWSVSADGHVMKGNTAVPGGGDTSAVQLVGCTVFGKDNNDDPSRTNAGGWFTLGGDGWTPSQAPTAAAAMAPAARTSIAPVTAVAATAQPAAARAAVNVGACISSAQGAFGILNGQIFTPQQTSFFARGINLYDANMGDASQVLANFPGLNFIRLNVYSFQSPSAYSAFVSQMTAAGVVVEFEDHTSSDGVDSGGGTGTVFAGGTLSNEMSWYTQMAAFYAGNPYVWYGTDNEPPEDPSAGALSDWQLATYNAIRAGSQTAVIMIEMNCDKSGCGNGYNVGDYSTMTNTVWDPHYYGWITDFNTDQGTVGAALANEISGSQKITGAGGQIMPVIIGEYGNATDGQNVDPNGSQVVQAVQTSGVGFAAWNWASGAPADNLTSGGALTSYGQQVAAGIAAAAAAHGNGTAPACSASSAPAAGTIAVADNGAPPTATPVPTIDPMTAATDAATAVNQDAKAQSAAADAQISQAEASIAANNQPSQTPAQTAALAAQATANLNAAAAAMHPQ